MGFKYEKRSTDEVESTADSLTQCSAALTRVALKMHEHQMTEAIFPWVNATWKAIDTVRELCDMAEVMIANQVAAKKQGRKSKYELAMEKSVIDVAKRKAKNSKKAASPTPTAGRVRKKKGA